MSLAIAVISSMVVRQAHNPRAQRRVGGDVLRAVAGEMIGDRRRTAVAAGEDQPVVLDGLLEDGGGAIDFGRPHGSETPGNEACIVRDEGAGVGIFPAGELG